jgi:hypothetical protein
MSNKPDSNIISIDNISYMIEGVIFNNPKEVIEILKNKYEPNDEFWLEYFEIFIIKWPPKHQKFIPHYTKKNLLKLINSIPTISETDIKIRYKYEKDKLKVALSQLK